MSKLLFKPSSLYKTAKLYGFKDVIENIKTTKYSTSILLPLYIAFTLPLFRSPHKWLQVS